ncbi:MAG: hypothetical protein WC969_00085 [Elusimicrobiota bacterium]|jgi:hypothetical protein
MSARSSVLLAAVGLLPAASFAAGLSARPEPASALESLRMVAVAPGAAVADIVGRALQGPDEARIEKVCASPLPVLVLDNFAAGTDAVSPYMDVDGDGKPDAGHGEVVSAIYKASGKKTRPLNMGGDGSIEHLVALLGPVAARLEKGSLALSAINVSQCVDVPLSDVQKDLGLPYGSEQFLAHRAEVDAAIAKLMNEKGSPHYGKLSRIAARIAKKGVPIYLAAGNQGPGKVNLLGFLPGTVSVGSIGRDGRKAASSADNGLTSVWRPGEYAFRRTADGNVDVNGDGLGDFDAKLMSKGPPLAAAYAGKPMTEVLRTPTKDPELDIIRRDTPGGVERLTSELQDGLYRVDDLIAFFRIDGARAESLRRHGPYLDKSMRFHFTASAAGTVVFDPAGDGSPGQVLLMAGTSFAAPALCLKSGSPKP